MNDRQPALNYREVALDRFTRIAVLEVRLPFAWQRSEKAVAVKLNREGEPVSCALMAV